MPPRRVRAPRRPVRITLDGAELVADADGSLAAALVGAGHLVLARSPKFHRPRGPACLRAGCDGCLMRVDGVPNVMTCVVPAREGARCERQNVLLSASVDLLRATDWFFPNGMNHHEMFAGIPGVQGVMQAFARRVSGLGELPEQALPPRAGPLPTRTTDVLVVGAGPAGLLAATALARAGRSVTVVDEQAAPGGSLGYFPPRATPRLGAQRVDVDAWRARTLDAALGAGVIVLTTTTLLGVLEGGDWLADGLEGLLRIEAGAHVVATGAHDGVASFVGNDLPGVVSARAAGRLLREGVLVGARPVVAGEGPFADAFVEAARAEGASVQRVALAAVDGVRGLSSVRTVVVRDGRGERRLDADALVVDAPVAPSFELAGGAGAEVAHQPAGYRVVVDAHGATRGARRLLAIGEVAGAPLDLDLLAAAADRLAGHLQGAR